MSDNYRALTRTYRPTSFDDIVSQQHVSSTLKNAIKKNRLAHAYMFCGPRGVGKTTMARVLARTVNEIDQEVDGEDLNQTLNVVEIDAASNNSVDDIRDLRERVRIPPQNGRYKIYIIDEVHMLSKSAFNALLKTLEEPPDHVIFIFATTEPHKVLPTILSRVQRFDFKRISVDQIVDRLKKVAQDQGISIDGESLHVIAKKADGALRDALGLMDQAIAFCGNDIQHEELLRALNVVSTDRLFDFMKAIEQKDSSMGLELINDLLEEGYDIQEFLVGLTEHLRNLYVARSSAKMHLVEASPETKKRYQNVADSFSEDDMMRMLHIVSEAQYKIKEAHQPKIQLEITLLKLIHMERSEKINNLLSQLEQLKKKLSNSSNIRSAETAATPDSESNTEKETSQSRESDKDFDDNSPSENGQPKKQAPKALQSPEETEKEEPSDITADNAKENGESSDTVADNAADIDSTPAEQITNPQPQTESGDDELSNLFGESSLGGPRQPNPKNNAEVATSDQESEQAVKAKRAPKDVSLKEIKDEWDSYIDDLRNHVPQMLYFQMQRVDPIELKNGELVLRCNDDFSKKIVEENKRRLSKHLENHIGAFLSFDSRVQKDESNQEETTSPYERFKRLQERDPTIKKLVELFGAELDYNLNQ